MWEKIYVNIDNPGSITLRDWVGTIIALIGIIFLFAVIVCLIIDHLTGRFSLIHMKYDDFLKDWGRKSYSKFFYTRKLKKLSQNKSTSEIKDDIDKASTFREIFIKVYLSRRKEELKSLSTEDLLKENYDHLYEKEMYEDVVEDRLNKLDINELINLFKKESFGCYKDVFCKVYEEKLEINLSTKDIDDLLYMFKNYENEILTRSKIKEIICDILYTKARRLSKYERMYFKENAPDEILHEIGMYY